MSSMPTIQIFDLDERRILAFDMVDILQLIEPFATGLRWYIARCEIVCLVNGTSEIKDAIPAWVLGLRSTLADSKEIVAIEWDTLKEFARNILQTEWANLIAVNPGATPPAEPLDLNNPAFEIVVQAVDTGFWAITTRNDALIANVANHFKATKIVEKAVRYF
jgi:hypothetical protein